jgi:hypothetical protein
MRKARSGDKPSILAVLRGHGVDPIILGYIDGAWSGDFAKRVAAIKHKKRRRMVGASLPVITQELCERFGFDSNIARHLAYGKGYRPENEEAERQLRYEFSNTEIGISN